MKKITYRPEIDGLRAIAVLPVILFHGGITFFSGGYVGVDVFFVISGYLITLMIISETENERFSLMNFYERRIRRIIPALFFVILVCLPFAWFMMLPYQIRGFSQSLVSVVFFVSNFLFWQKSNYFAPDSDQMPLLHTWSLAVEEQFYIFFPLLIIFFWRFGKRNNLILLILIASISLIFSEIQSKSDPQANFYLLPSRIWELLLGSVIAIYFFNREVLKNNFLSILGLILILLSIFFFDENTRFPSFYALIPVLGTCLVIVFSNKETLTSKILSSSIPVKIGLISYSAYLWHQPIFAFASIKNFGHPSTLIMFLLGILSLILAFFSWKFIETPFRDRNKISRKTLFSLFAIFSVLILAIGIFGHSTNGFYAFKTSLIDEEKRMFLFDRNSKYSERDKYWKFKLKDSYNDFTQSNKEKVLILGDSQGKDFYVSSISSESLMNKYEFRYVDLDDECMNFNLMSENPAFNCNYIKSILERSTLIEDADQIVLAAHWKKNSWQNPLLLANELSNQAEIKIIGSLKITETSSIAMHSAKNNFSYEDMSKFSFDSINDDFTYSIKIKEATKKIENVYFFDKSRIFCNNDKRKCNFFDKKEGFPLIWDNMHITIEGIDLFSDWIKKEVLN